MFTTNLMLAALAIVNGVRSSVISQGSGQWIMGIQEFPVSYTSTNNVHRKLMASLYFPVLEGDCADVSTEQAYMTASAARVSNQQFFAGDAQYLNVFTEPTFKVCKRTKDSARYLDPQTWTPVILEPQVGTSRYLYGAMAQELASHNYAVITIDHPYDSAITEFVGEEGSSAETILGNIALDPFAKISSWNKTIDGVVNARVLDIKAIMDRLTQPAFVQKIFTGWQVKSEFDTKRAGIIGHGIGGTVATLLSATDDCFGISVNMAGPAPPLTKDTTNYIVYLGRTPGGRREDEANWLETWPHFKGRVVELDLKNADVFAYSDLGKIVAMQLGAVPVAKSAVKGLGNGMSIDNEKAFGIAAQFPRAWLQVQYGVDAGQWHALTGLMQFFPDDMLPYNAITN